MGEYFFKEHEVKSISLQYFLINLLVNQQSEFCEKYTNIGTIYLSGGTAALKGLASMVQQELGMTTRIADPVTGMDIAQNVAVTAIKRNANNLMIAMGLALRGFD